MLGTFVNNRPCTACLLQPPIALSGLLGLRSVHARCLGTVAASPGTTRLGRQHRAMWWRAPPTQRGPGGHATASLATLAPLRGQMVLGAAPAQVWLSLSV